MKSLRGAHFLHLVCQVERLAPPSPRQLRHWNSVATTYKCHCYQTICLVWTNSEFLLPNFRLHSRAIFTKFHSMTSSCLFNRGTIFSETVTYNNNVFLSTDTKSIAQDTHSAQRCWNKNRQNRTFYNSVGGCITGFKRNFWLAKFLTSRHMRMHRAAFNISNALRKLITRA